MKLNKIFLLAGIALAGMLTSCSDDDKCGGESVSGHQVFFANYLKTTIELSAEKSSVSIPLNRSNADGAITVPLTATSSSEDITVVPSVNFADGEKVTDIEISYNPDNIEMGKYDTLTIAIADEYTTPYGASDITLLVGMSEPFVSIGTGKFYDSFQDEEGKYWDVEIEQSLLNPSTYRVVAPYRPMWEYYAEEEGDEGYLEFAEASSDYLTFRILEKGSTLGEIEITEEGIVYFEPVNSGFLHASYGEYIWAYHPAHFTIASMALYSNNYIADYTEDGAPGEIDFAPYYYLPGIGGWNYTTSPGSMKVIMPGYEMKDYSIDLTYAGIFTDTSNAPFATAYLTLGADATDVKAVVVSTKEDADEVADKVAAGEIEATDVEAGRIEVPIADQTGELQVVAVVVVDGVAKAVATAKFEYYGGGQSPWVSLGTGYYTDDFVISMYVDEEKNPIEPYTYAVEIEENTETPGLYRIINAYVPIAELLEEDGGYESLVIHAEDPEAVYFTTQYIGIGEMAIVSVGGDDVESFDGDVEYAKENYPEEFGTLKDGVITLPTFVEERNGITYQGYLYEGAAGYYTGCNGAFKLVLPDAPEAVKARAKAKAQATQFAQPLKAANLKATHRQAKKVKRVLKTKPQTVTLRQF